MSANTEDKYFEYEEQVVEEDYGESMQVSSNHRFEDNLDYENAYKKCDKTQISWLMGYFTGVDDEENQFHSSVQKKEKFCSK